MARFSMLRPTRLGTAAVIAFLSAVIIFIVAEVFLNLLEESGFIVELPYIILSVIIFGAALSWIILILLVRRKVVYVRAN